MGNERAEAKPSCLQKFSHAIESRMGAFFSRLGELVAIHPAKTVLLALVGEANVVVVVVQWGGVRGLKENTFLELQKNMDV